MSETEQLQQRIDDLAWTAALTDEGWHEVYALRVALRRLQEKERSAAS